MKELVTSPYETADNTPPMKQLVTPFAFPMKPLRTPLPMKQLVISPYETAGNAPPYETAGSISL